MRPPPPGWVREVVPLPPAAYTARGPPSAVRGAPPLFTVEQFCKRIGKVPITCKDRPGFVVNRFFVPWLNEAVLILEDGLGTPEQIDAIAKDDEIVINVGDMLSRYTNNKLKSTIHKVINPPKEMWRRSRYSIPFFLHPIGTMSLNVLDSCIDDNNPKKYKDITAHEFLIQRLKDIGVL